MRKNERTASAQMYSDAESAGRSEHGAVTDNPARAEHSADTDTAHRTRAAEILPPRGSMPESDGDCLDYVATCLFGLERLVGEEIDALGYERTFTMDGRVGFRAGADAAARCAICGSVPPSGCMPVSAALPRLPLTLSLREQRRCRGSALSAGRMHSPLRDMPSARSCTAFPTARV